MGIFGRRIAAIRGTSFGDRWLEVDTDQRTLAAVARRMEKTGPRSIRSDNIVLEVKRGQVRVLLEGTAVGVLAAAHDPNSYAEVITAAGHPVQTSGIILIDAEGHPGLGLKLYAPAAAELVPANLPDTKLPWWFALDRAGGLTVARSAQDHRMITDAASALPERCSVWIVAERTPDGTLRLQLEDHDLPTVDDGRQDALLDAWDRRMAGHDRVQLEGSLYTIKAGPQINVRYALGR